MSATTSQATRAEERGIFKKVADYRLRPHGIRVLLTPIAWEEHYQVPGTRTFTAPAGMEHDGASIPRVLSFINGSSIQLAASLHDAAYRFQRWDKSDSGEGDPMTRSEADRMMREAARACQMRARAVESVSPAKATLLVGTHFLQRWVIWLGLTIGGFVAWQRSPAKRDRIDHAALNEIRDIIDALDLARKVVPVDDAFDLTVSNLERRGVTEELLRPQVVEQNFANPAPDPITDLVGQGAAAALDEVAL